MKSKEYIVLGVIIVLLGAYLFLRSGDRSRYELPALPETAADEVSKIEISTPGQALSLTRSDDQWRIGENKYPADGTRVKAMLSALNELKLTALVSEAGIYDNYDLTDDKKIEVAAWIGDRLVRDLDIGKVADTHQHTFVRLRDDPNVYHAGSNFRETFNQTIEDLRDKSALSFTAADITGIDIVSAEKSLSLSLTEQPVETPPSREASGETDPQASEPVWMKDDETPADADAVQRLLSQLASLYCSNYLDGRQKDAFPMPLSTITLKGEETYTLSLYEKEATETVCSAVSSQNDYPFTLSETACTRLTETLEKITGTETGS